MTPSSLAGPTTVALLCGLVSLWSPPLAAAPPESASATAPGGPAAEIDALHLRRDDPAVQATLKSRLSPTAVRDDFDLLWRAARFRIWLADVTTDVALKRTLGAEAAELAHKAVAKAPQRVEGHYYEAMGIGIYCQAVGVMKTLREGRDKAFTAALDRALKLDPMFDRGGPLLAKGRYYHELPWPLRDLGKSVAHYQQILARFPFRPRARLFLAEALLKDGRDADAREAAKHIFDADTGQDPPESRRVRQLVQSSQGEIQRAVAR
jgi:hypothetical protein